MAGLILALDVTDRDAAMKIAYETKEYLHAIKVGWPLIMAAGMEIVDLLSQIAPVICDFKVADIPNTTKLIVSQAKKHGATGIIVHGFVGRDSLKAAVDEAGKMKVYVVAEMSHPGALDFMQKHADEIVKMARDVGAAGLIAPATRPERIREIRVLAGNMEILSPGVGAQGGRARETIEAGANHVIVGRSIYNAQNPKEAARAIYEEIKLL
ncbi:orotidine 5'-phosphate decarboxylase, subfamily 1 [Aciduliprofundum sp. MAR08-339]|uniref:orotidine-5'-phosphate decarboxylase n=1 Tax=Aciduliprofundum sp. (strain MAR08-339) TaxID=673860 RepID=UPI0002A48D38|nr:orotidine 5'-phosphate decarboxylase, subfamily 1 [Aciduliprofundum sp. MAR08-339]